MKINLDSIKNIELCYENCEVDKIENKNLLGLSIARKLKSKYDYKNKPAFNIKTFEIALKDTYYTLRTDLAQLTINYNDGNFDHFYIAWGEKDISWGTSSLQKVHRNDNQTSLTSNCESEFLL